jgi:hypothetical protein
VGRTWGEPVAGLNLGLRRRRMPPLARSSRPGAALGDGRASATSRTPMRARPRRAGVGGGTSLSAATQVPGSRPPCAGVGFTGVPRPRSKRSAAWSAAGPAISRRSPRGVDWGVDYRESRLLSQTRIGLPILSTFRSLSRTHAPRSPLLLLGVVALDVRDPVDSQARITVETSAPSGTRRRNTCTLPARCPALCPRVTQSGRAGRSGRIARWRTALAQDRACKASRTR